MPHIDENIKANSLEFLRESKSQGINYVRLVFSDPCHACAKYDSKVSTINAAMGQPVFVNPECKGYPEYSEMFCVSFYEVVFDDELP